MVNPQLVTPDRTIYSKPSFLVGDEASSPHFRVSKPVASPTKAPSTLNPFDSTLPSTEKHVLHKADFNTINHVVQSALLQMVMPQLNALQERLGMEPTKDWEIPKNSEVNEGSIVWPESPAAPRRRSIDSSKPSMLVEDCSQEPSMANSTAAHSEAKKSSEEPISPSASLRRWLAHTSDIHHRDRLHELIQEADEFGCPVDNDEKTTSNAKQDIPVVQAVSHYHKSPNSFPGKLCQKPLKECLFEEAGVRLVDSRIPELIAEADENNRALQGRATETREKDSQVTIEAATTLLEEMLKTKNDNDEVDKPVISNVSRQMQDSERAKQEQTFQEAFESLRQELLENMADLKDKLHAIPDLTERKVTSKLLRPAKTIMYGPRELPGMKTACFADYFKNNRAKKDKQHLEHLLSSLLESVDGLKSDFRDAEVQRIMGQSSISPEKSNANSPAAREKRLSTELPRLATSSKLQVPAEREMRDDSDSIRSFSTMQMMNSPIDEVESKAFPPRSKAVGEISVERPRVSPRGARAMSTISKHRATSFPAAVSTVGKRQK